MYFTYFFFLWILWILPIKSQIHLKPINYYEPVPANGLVSPSLLKPYKPLIISYPDSQRDLSWVKNLRLQHKKKAPQRQQFVLYCPPPKPNYNSYEKYQNFKTKNPGIKNNKNNYYNRKSKNFNKIVPEEPKELQEGHLSWESLEAAKERVKIKNGETQKNLFNNQIRNQEQKKNLNYGNEDSYPPVPNSFMEPPGFATSDYRLYQKADGNFVGGNKKDYEKENYYKNHKMNGEQEDFNNNFNDRAPYVRDHAPEKESEELEQSSELEEEDIEEQIPKKTSHPSEISPDGDRVEFQIQGHAGPKTYVFGYDTGDGNNRQYRLEERLKDGTVKGQYGYYDARGKLRAIKYIARPLEGYEEKHHEAILPSTNSSN